MPGFCRDCRRDLPERAGRCPHCASPRLLRHPELDALALAHVDCDAFYATIEKRDDPTLADKPVIVGGRKRGVVLTACYVARTFGVRSAMPMFEARRLCPHASVVPPDMEKYARVGREVRGFMLEAHAAGRAGLDRRGVHGSVRHRAPARHEFGQGVAGFAAEVEHGLGITVSIGLSCNKFLAKIASDLDKPRLCGAWPRRGRGLPGGQAGDDRFRRRQDDAAAARARRAAYHRRPAAHRRNRSRRRYADEGVRLARLARGIDDRSVSPEREAKSISSETTFEQDIAESRPPELRSRRLCETVSARLKESGSPARP